MNLVISSQDYLKKRMLNEYATIYLIFLKVSLGSCIYNLISCLEEGYTFYSSFACYDVLIRCYVKHIIKIK